ncbi:prepilin peptidase, partial [Escherichia coli]|nr:prepilin peptidase [Escherichia coli]EET8911557.1 prepilin peptidase [Escherichia coli]EEY7335558.1 prepilin peptidase [Escherichia coli]EHH8644451.1 prepilin peptidase [Escherichia coli]HAG5789793.1 prepilin peptidase [Escherichia coli]
MFLIILLVISATLTIQLLAIRVAGHYLMQVHTLRLPRHLSLLCVVLALTATITHIIRGTDITGLCFLLLMAGCMTLMTLTDATSCRLPRPFTLTFLMLGVAFRLWQGDAAIALACA